MSNDLIVESTEQQLFLQFNKMAGESFVKNKTRIIIAPDHERSVFRIQLTNIATGEIVKEQYLSKAISKAISHIDEFWDEAQALQMVGILKVALQELDRIIDKKGIAA